MSSSIFDDDNDNVPKGTGKKKKIWMYYGRYTQNHAQVHI